MNRHIADGMVERSFAAVGLAIGFFVFQKFVIEPLFLIFPCALLLKIGNNQKK